jgi:hypothetical protein
MKLSDLQALDLISRLPDDVPLTVEEAAIFLRMSPSTLNKMRMPGHPTGGPVYSQGGKRGASGSNQKVLYLKKDLIVWLEANRVADTHAAAVRKGQMFRTLADLVEERPFWRDATGRIAGTVEDTDVDVFFARIGTPLWSVEWLPATDAVTEPWTDEASLHAFADSLDGVVSTFRGTLAASKERATLDSFASEAKTLIDRREV